MLDGSDMNDGRRPSRAVSLSVSALLVVIWGTVRLLIFDTIMFPLAYAIPLLVCVWTRDPSRCGPWPRSSRSSIR